METTFLLGLSPAKDTCLECHASMDDYINNVYSCFLVKCSASPPSTAQDHSGIQAGKFVYSQLVTEGKLRAPALLTEIRSRRGG